MSYLLVFGSEQQLNLTICHILDQSATLSTDTVMDGNMDCCDLLADSKWTRENEFAVRLHYHMGNRGKSRSVGHTDEADRLVHVGTVKGVSTSPSHYPRTVTYAP